MIIILDSIFAAQFTHIDAMPCADIFLPYQCEWINGLVRVDCMEKIVHRYDLNAQLFGHHHLWRHRLVIFVQ